MAMSRLARAQQLSEMIRTDEGRDQILELYRQAAGIPWGTMVPVGMLFSQMVTRILEVEFPAAESTAAAR